MSALTCSVVHFGCAATTSAARPAACGVAIDVPLSLRPPLPVPMPAERIVLPGADRSGLPMYPSVMPRDVKPTTWSFHAGSTCLVARNRLWLKVTVVLSTPAPRISSPAVLVMSTIGIDALPATPAANRSSSSWATTPIAPAAVALFARVAEPQRRVASLSVHSTQATLPLTPAASAAEYGKQPSGLLGSVSW